MNELGVLAQGRILAPCSGLIRLECLWFLEGKYDPKFRWLNFGRLGQGFCFRSLFWLNFDYVNCGVEATNSSVWKDNLEAWIDICLFFAAFWVKSLGVPMITFWFWGTVMLSSLETLSLFSVSSWEGETIN